MDQTGVPYLITEETCACKFSRIVKNRGVSVAKLTWSTMIVVHSGLCLLYLQIQFL